MLLEPLCRKHLVCFKVLDCALKPFSFPYFSTSRFTNACISLGSLLYPLKELTRHIGYLARLCLKASLPLALPPNNNTVWARKHKEDHYNALYKAMHPAQVQGQTPSKEQHLLSTPTQPARMKHNKIIVVTTSVNHNRLLRSMGPHRQEIHIIVVVCIAASFFSNTLFRHLQKRKRETC
jgi:hypothetical protein